MTIKSSTPAPGWWAVPHNIGNDRKWAQIPEEQVLACIGLYLASTGYCIAYEIQTVSFEELSRHIVCGAASTQSVMDAAQHLLAAGIWTDVPGVGIDCGAAHHILAKTERIERARKGGEAKAAKQAQAQYLDRQETLDGGIR